jgi:hypothetical protein
LLVDLRLLPLETTVSDQNRAMRCCQAFSRLIMIDLMGQHARSA